jgi:hypothetical protein
MHVSYDLQLEMILWKQSGGIYNVDPQVLVCRSANSCLHNASCIALQDEILEEVLCSSENAA